ncbi:hypothetical protein K501DRAFT_336431 [Backusella circina FSU 941]|nr:hypothetical protein K501DRAFT_336431 [Backusella circina FSU 941]
MTFEVSSTLEEASSLHPHILTTLNLQQHIPDPTCHLDLVYIFPPSVFVDIYQLKDKQTSLGKATLFGEQNLELPLERVTEKRGSILFLRQPPSQVNLPLHLRYQRGRLNQDRQPITIPPPFAGWTCGGGAWPPLSQNYSLVPHDVTGSQFYPLTHHPDPLQLSVPIGKLEASPFITVGTFGVVVSCTIWICVAIYRSIQRNRRSEAKGKRRKSE